MNMVGVKKMHDEKGKVYVQASEFYKQFIMEQLEHSAHLGEDFFNETRFQIQKMLADSMIVRTLEPAFIDEAFLYSSLSYEKIMDFSKQNLHEKKVKAIKEYDEKKKKQEEEEALKQEQFPSPALRLVK